jgi:hypothetical protein
MTLVPNDVGNLFPHQGKGIPMFHLPGGPKNQSLAGWVQTQRSTVSKMPHGDESF